MSDFVRPSIKLMHERYEYWNKIPKRGLFIDGRPAITQVDPDKIGDYLIYIVRDPLGDYGKDPAGLMAELLDEPELAGQSGMFTTYTGSYKGARISICSGGSGGPEVELAINEFMEHTRCNTFIRLGTAGGVAEEVKTGDFVISSGIFRDEGTSKAYISRGFPAGCSYELIMAFIQAADELELPYKVGITASMDSDYVGNGRPSVGGYLQPRSIEKLGIYNRAGVLCTDRESAIVVTMCNLFGRRGGALFHVTDNIISGEHFEAGKGAAESLVLALEGLSLLHRLDNQKKMAGKNYWHPGLQR